MDYAMNSERLSNGSGIIIINGDIDKIGTILSCNSALQSMFSYPKEKFVNSKLDIIIPGIIQESHRKALLRTQYRNFEDNSEHILSYGLHASLCVFPVKIKVNKISNTEDNYNVIGQLSQIYQTPDEAIIITTTNGMIQHCNYCIVIISRELCARNSAIISIRIHYRYSSVPPFALRF